MDSRRFVCRLLVACVVAVGLIGMPTGGAVAPNVTISPAGVHGTVLDSGDSMGGIPLEAVVISADLDVEALVDRYNPMGSVPLSHAPGHGTESGPPDHAGPPQGCGRGDEPGRPEDCPPDERGPPEGVPPGGDEDPPELEEEEPPTVACTDSRGCPDLLVDSSRMLQGLRLTEETFSEDDCNVVEGSTEPGTRRLMRFTMTTPNLGEGDLFVGNALDRPDLFEWGECHGHWHFIEYASYRLWSVEGFAQWRAVRAAEANATAEEILDANPHLRDEMVSGNKLAFCLIDIDWYDPFAPQNFFSCSFQGISRGWADEYPSSLAGQFVDVTDVPPGVYVLEAEVNPERIIEEADYGNNWGAVLVTVPSGD